MIHVRVAHRAARLLAFACLTLLSACAGTKVDRAASVAGIQDKAIIVVSVSHDYTAFKDLNAHVALDGFFDGSVVLSSNGQAPLPFASRRSDFPDRHGHLYVQEVTPGHHELTNWWVTRGDQRTGGASAKKLGFDVARGEVLYLGNVHASIEMGETLLFHKKVPYAARAAILDRSATDIEFAEKTYPALAGRIRVAVLPLGAWSREEGNGGLVGALVKAMTPDKAAAEPASAPRD